MLRNLSRYVLVLGLLIVVSGCRSAPVYNVENATYPIQKPLSMEQVGRLIRTAAAGRGWIVRHIGPGLIEAKHSVRTHIAEVEITYDTSKFSITYKDSQDLNYTGTAIHKNYNSWVKNLENDIRAQASAL